MILTLKILGICALIFIVMMIAFNLLMKRWMKRKTQDYLTMMDASWDDEENALIYADQLILKPIHQHQVIQEAQLKKWLQLANAKGFKLLEPNGIYASNLPNDLDLCILSNETQTLHMALYLDEVGTSLRVTMFGKSDDKIYRVTNDPTQIVPTPENIQNIFFQVNTLDIFCDQAVKILQAKQPQPVEYFQKLLVELYRQQHEHLIHMDFADAEYIAQYWEKHLPQDNQAALLEQVYNTQDAIRNAYIQQIPMIAINQYLKDHSMDALTWQRYSRNLVVVHERQTALNIWENIRGCFVALDYDADKGEVVERPIVANETIIKLSQLKEEMMFSPFAFMAGISQLLPQPYLLQPLGKVNYPVAAEIFYLSED